MAAQFLSMPTLSRPDAFISASPSFPALLPAALRARTRHLPWILWLLDILPDGAATTGIVDESSSVVRTARMLERVAYRVADRIVVISEAFTENLIRKGVPEEKIELIYCPATRTPLSEPDYPQRLRSLRLLGMGNIGHSQGIAALIAAFEASEELSDCSLRFVVTGDGMAAGDVRAEIRSNRIELPGIVDDDRLEHELQSATLGFVSQRHDGIEFNIPSKIMNFMRYGLPILAVVSPESEVARIVTQSGAGWVVDSSRPYEFPRRLAEILRSPSDLEKRGRAGLLYAEKHFTPSAFVDRFARVVAEVCSLDSRVPKRR